VVLQAIGESDLLLHLLQLHAIVMGWMLLLMCRRLAVAVLLLIHRSKAV
jgi:hypothetical protein